MKNKRTKEEIENAVKQSLSIAGVCRLLGIKPVGGNYKTLQYAIQEYGIDISHFTGQAWNQGARYRQIKLPRSLDEILVENSNYQTYKLKERLIKEGYKECKCEYCGRTEWNNQTIPLELHHINGNHFDNRLENLQVLCPNCHAQTDNFRTKNKVKSVYKEDKRNIKYKANKEVIEKPKKPIKSKNKCIICGKETNRKTYCSNECRNKDYSKNKLTKEQLLDLSKQVSSLAELNRKINLGVTDNAVKKWCDQYGIYDEIKSNFKQRTFPILQYDLEDNFIKEWKDADTIVKELGLNKSKIQRCCREIRKTSAGFKWRYKEN